MTADLINKVVHFARYLVFRSIDIKSSLEHSDTYSFQLRIYSAKTNDNEENKNSLDDIESGKLKVQNPYMDNTSLRQNAYFYVKSSTKKLSKYVIVLWTYAHEMYRPPKNQHFVSNMIYVKAYNSDGEVITEKDAPNLNYTVTFPLRVLLPDTELKKHLKCGRIAIENTKEIAMLHDIESIDEGNGNVDCMYKSMVGDEL